MEGSGEGDGGDRAAALKRSTFNGLKGVGENDVGGKCCAAVEGFTADGLEISGESEGGEGVTVSERSIFNGLDRVGERDGGDRIQELERHFSDSGDGISVDGGGDVEVGDVGMWGEAGDGDFVVTGGVAELIDGGGVRKSDGGGGEKGDEAAADLFHGVSCMLINGI